MIYLDHNATTPVDERVFEAMAPYLCKFYGNPSSLYRHGRAVRTALEMAREQVATLVGVHASQVVFTSGGTETNNLVFASIAQMFEPGHVLIGATEHPSIMEPAGYLASLGWHVESVPVNDRGLIDPAQFESLLQADTRLVSIMLANNETGVIQEHLSTLSEFTRKREILLHTDAVQATGKIETRFDDLGVQLMSLSAHKIYGPKGVGALIFDKRVDFQPLQRGGGQEQGIRAGTENTAGIVGFGKAAELACQELASRALQLRQLRDHLEARLADIPGIHIVAREAERLPNTVQIMCDGLDGEMLLMQLDQQGFAVSSGSACSSNNREPSSVLLAMGVSRTQALGALRISLGVHNSIQELDRFAEAMRGQVGRPR